jgi:hypothetical protein
LFSLLQPGKRSGYVPQALLLDMGALTEGQGTSFELASHDVQKSTTMVAWEDHAPARARTGARRAPRARERHSAFVLIHTFACDRAATNNR